MLIFDMEGTLVDSVPQTLQCRKGTFEQFGYDVSLRTLHRHSGRDPDEMVRSLLTPQQAQQHADELKREQGRRFREIYLPEVMMTRASISSSSTCASIGVRRMVGNLLPRGGRGAPAESKCPSGSRSASVMNVPGRGNSHTNFARCHLLLLLSGYNRKSVVDEIPDRAVAFAGHRLQLAAIEDLHATTPTADHAGTLQRLRHEGNRGAAHTEHLAQEFLGYRYDVSIGAVMSLQEPPAKPRLQLVECTASNRLLDLRKQEVVVAQRQLVNSGALAGGRTKFSGRQLAGAAG
jgi:hypothetical protein